MSMLKFVRVWNCAGAVTLGVPLVCCCASEPGKEAPVSAPVAPAPAPEQPAAAVPADSWFLFPQASRRKLIRLNNSTTADGFTDFEWVISTPKTEEAAPVWPPNLGLDRKIVMTAKIVSNSEVDVPIRLDTNVSAELKFAKYTVELSGAGVSWQEWYFIRMNKILTKQTDNTNLIDNGEIVWQLDKSTVSSDAFPNCGECPTSTIQTAHWVTDTAGIRTNIGMVPASITPKLVYRVLSELPAAAGSQTRSWATAGRTGRPVLTGVLTGKQYVEAREFCGVKLPTLLQPENVRIHGTGPGPSWSEARSQLVMISKSAKHPWTGDCVCNHQLCDNGGECMCQIDMGTGACTCICVPPEIFNLVWTK
ncbi:MAG: hypothetical protein JSR77_13625 [Planctomycetes bacterium]|nr:hypothetical protein [Planctomycetota bacterium]